VLAAIAAGAAAALVAAVLVVAYVSPLDSGRSDAPATAAGRTGSATPTVGTPAPPAWHLADVPPSQPTSVLRDVAAVDATHAWTVGTDRYSPTQSSTSGVPMIHEWDDARWSRVALPPAIGWHGGLMHVAAGSATDVWAVGGSAGPDLDDTITHVLHDDGTGWREVPFPLSNAPSTIQITDLAAAGGHAWLIGNDIGQTVIQEWDGTSWRAHRPPAECLQAGTSFGGMPTFCNLTAITALAADNVWACGNGAWPGFQGPALFHWDGNNWHTITLGQNQSRSTLTAITARGGRDIWAVGDNLAQGGGTLAIHGDGTTWQTVDGLPPSRVEAVTQDADGRPWVIANHPDPSATLVTHGTKTWTATAAPTPPGTVGMQLYGIAAVPGTAQMLAVGAADLPTDPRLLTAAILQYSAPQ
jgi:hypothetical protein